jgi:uncharacterized membrane protein
MNLFVFQLRAPFFNVGSVTWISLSALLNQILNVGRHFFAQIVWKLGLLGFVKLVDIKQI